MMTDGELPRPHEAEISSKDSQKGIIANKVYTYLPYLPNPEWFSKPSFSESSVLFRAPPILVRCIPHVYSMLAIFHRAASRVDKL